MCDIFLINRGLDAEHLGLCFLWGCRCPCAVPIDAACFSMYNPAEAYREKEGDRSVYRPPSFSLYAKTYWALRYALYGDNAVLLNMIF